MMSMKAKVDYLHWVPFGHKLEQCEIKQDIDFSLIEFKSPYMTDVLGQYSGIDYQFTDGSLKKLTSQLDKAHTKRQEKEEGIS